MLKLLVAGQEIKTLYTDFTSHINNLRCVGGKREDRLCTYTCNNDARSRYRCRRGKSIIITYSECGLVALFIQHAKCMRHIVVCNLSALYRFSPILS
jgi:hypothetical protein